MRILLDLQACQSGSRLGGIGRYSLSLAKAMISEAPSHDFYVVLNGLMPLHECELRLDFADLLAPEKFVSFAACGAVSAHHRSHHVRKDIAEMLREDFLRRLQPDIVHVASLVEGWGDDVVTSLGCPELAAKTAVTWYDLIPYLRPEMYLNNADLAQHYYSKIDEAKKAGLLLAISQYTCEEAVQHLGFEQHQVINIAAGVDPRFCPAEVRSETLQELRQQFGISKPFLMYTGSFDTRKNQPALIQAFAKLPIELRSQYQLVIAGNGWPGVYGELRSVGRRAGLTDECLVFTGRVTDDQLLALYNQCHLFVFPSLCEGFGLPALEAMACGTATIGSNCTSIPEVIGREDALFDPRSVDSISQKIYDVLSQEAFRAELRSYGLERAKQFTWANSAKLAIAAFEEQHARQRHARSAKNTLALPIRGKVDGARTSSAIVNAVARTIASHQDHDDYLPAMASAIEHNERIADQVLSSQPARPARTGWVTTWETRCGIASYTKYLIEAAASKPTVILAEGKGPAKQGNPGTPVRYCWQAGDDDLVKLSREISHHRLDVLYMQFNYGFFDFKALIRFIDEQTQAGVRIIITMHSTQDPPKFISPKRLSELRDALALCERVLVHTEHDVARLRDIGLHRNVSLIAHGVLSAPPQPQISSVRSGPFTIATYGFFLKHKGLLELIEAFGALVREDPHLHLLMLNAEYSPAASGEVIESARAQLARLQLENHVTMCTEYLPDQECLTRLAEVDLVVYPYQQTGESSSAAVRMGLASGRPVATTPLPIFDDVNDIVAKLPGVSPKELHDGVKSLIERMRAGSDLELMTIQRRCDAWRQKYAIRNVARSLLSLSGNHAKQDTRAA
jgi:glycosyltransferase involved in cell wall biosynthesis